MSVLQLQVSSLKVLVSLGGKAAYDHSITVVKGSITEESSRWLLKIQSMQKDIQKAFLSTQQETPREDAMNTCSAFSKFKARVHFFYLADSILRAWNSSGPNIIPWEDWIWNASEKKLRRVYLFYMQLIITDLVSTVQAYKVFSYTAVALWLSCPCPWYSANHPRGHYVQWLCLQVAHPTTELLHQDWKDLHYSSVGQTLALLTWISE